MDLQVSVGWKEKERERKNNPVELINFRDLCAFWDCNLFFYLALNACTKSKRIEHSLNTLWKSSSHWMLCAMQKHFHRKHHIMVWYPYGRSFFFFLRGGFCRSERVTIIVFSHAPLEGASLFRRFIFAQAIFSPISDSHMVAEKIVFRWEQEVDFSGIK